MARSRSARVMCALGAIALLSAAQHAIAQMNDYQGFDGTKDEPFAYPTGTVQYWSVDGGCSYVNIFKDGTRGDGGSNCLVMPGTPSTGTRMIRDLNPGSGSSTFGDMARCYLDVIERVFISADDGSGAAGQELYWILDPLHVPLKLHTDLQPGANGSNPMNLFQHNPGAGGNIYYSADDGTTGREPWKLIMDNQLLITNSPAGDINPGPGSSNPSGFSAATYAAGTPAVTYKMVVFAADDGTHGRELWGMSASGPTALIADINTTSPTASSDPQQFAVVNLSGTDVKSFFTADNGVNGRELWRTDGTTGGTGMCKDIVAGAAGSDPADLTAVTLLNGAMNNPTLFFTVDSDGSGTRELWKSNGKLDGTDTLLVLDPGTAGSVSNLIAANKLNALFFTAGNALYKSDGTTAGTTLVKSFAAPPGPIVGNVGGSILYLVADDGAGAGLEIWKAIMDTGAMKVTLVKDIVAGSGTASPQNLCTVGDTLYFTANDGTNGRELWRTDANATVGAVMVKDINPGPSGSDPDKLIAYSGTVLFTANDGTHGRELWQSDGTPERTPKGMSYKWDVASLIAGKTGDPNRNVVAATDAKPLSIYWLYDLPAMGGGNLVSEAAHQINTYVEITNGTDRAPLNITQVDCGDGNLPRPSAALTDGNYHAAIAYGMVAVLDQNPCDTDSRGPGSPGVPFAYVPAVYDGHDWIPIDLAHIPAGVPTDPPSEASLAQAPWGWPARDATLPANLVAATTDPWAAKRFTAMRIDIWTDYIRLIFAGKNTSFVYVATVPRKYLGGFKAVYMGNPACVEPTYPFFFDTLQLVGGRFGTQLDPYGACCSPTGCVGVTSETECPVGIYSEWTDCNQAGYLCCPLPWADSNRDGDVDTEDFALLQRCLADSVAPECKCLDHNKDTKIDAADMQLFIDCAAGPGILTGPLPPQCN